jgi:hypothetical protein
MTVAVASPGPFSTHKMITRARNKKKRKSRTWLRLSFYVHRRAIHWVWLCRLTPFSDPARRWKGSMIGSAFSLDLDSSFVLRPSFFPGPPRVFNDPWCPPLSNRTVDSACRVHTLQFIQPANSTPDRLCHARNTSTNHSARIFISWGRPHHRARFYSAHDCVFGPVLRVCL